MRGCGGNRIEPRGGNSQVLEDECARDSSTNHGENRIMIPVAMRLKEETTQPPVPQKMESGRLAPWEIRDNLEFLYDFDTNDWFELQKQIEEVARTKDRQVDEWRDIVKIAATYTDLRRIEMVEGLLPWKSTEHREWSLGVAGMGHEWHEDETCERAVAKYGWAKLRWWAYGMACRINGRILWGWRSDTLDTDGRRIREITMQGVVGVSPQIRLIEPWGRTSWLVWYPGLYANERPPHIKLRNDESEPWPDEAKEGATFGLLEPKKSGRAVMREAVGICVGGDPRTPAHVTVHYGERPAADFRLLQEMSEAEIEALTPDLFC